MSSEGSFLFFDGGDGDEVLPLSSEAVSFDKSSFFLFFFDLEPAGANVDPFLLVSEPVPFFFFALI